jgi:hypothetical protein
MPFTGPVFANVSGASNAAPGQIVQSAVWNAIHEDYSEAFTQVMEQLIAQITNRNILWMNGGLEVWQRGAGDSASISVAALTTAYTADRWYLTTLANEASVVSAQAGLVGASQLSARIQRTAAQTGVGVMTFGYPLDTDEIVRMRGSVVTLSMLLSAGATWSPANGTLIATLYTGTGAVAKRGAGFTNEVTVLTVSTNLTPGGAAVAVSGTSAASVPANATQAEIQFTWTPVDPAGGTDYFQVDDVQIECNLSDDTWTPTNYDRLNFADMLAGCKRHYNKTFPYNIAPAAGAGLSNSLQIIAQSAERIGIWWQYPVEMRTNPAFTKYNPATATSSNWYTIASITSSVSSSISAGFDTLWATNATKGIFAQTLASAAIGNLAFIQAQADAGI